MNVVGRYERTAVDRYVGLSLNRDAILLVAVSQSLFVGRPGLSGMYGYQLIGRGNSEEDIALDLRRHLPQRPARESVGRLVQEVPAILGLRKKSHLGIKHLVVDDRLDMEDLQVFQDDFRLPVRGSRQRGLLVVEIGIRVADRLRIVMRL